MPPSPLATSYWYPKVTVCLYAPLWLQVVKGVPTARYAHDVEPFAIEKDIVKALSQTTAEL